MQYVKGQGNHETIFAADTESVDGDVNGDFKIFNDLSLKRFYRKDIRITQKIPMKF